MGAGVCAEAPGHARRGAGVCAEAPGPPVGAPGSVLRPRDMPAGAPGSVLRPRAVPAGAPGLRGMERAPQERPLAVKILTADSRERHLLEIRAVSGIFVPFIGTHG